MLPETLEALNKLRTDFELYGKTALKVRSKSGSIQPLILNRAQQHIHQQIEAQRAKLGRVRALILKGRQQGCSTYVEGRFYWRGPAVVVRHAADAMSETRVKCQWDGMGLGVVVYPRQGL